jgi:hypothetical protein
MRPFRLADAARVCVTHQGSVFLNIERDAYTGIDARQTRALASVVEDWPATGSPAEPDDDTLGLAATLSDLGLLVRSADARLVTSTHRLSGERKGPPLVLEEAPASPSPPSVATAALPPATEELFSWADMAPPRIRFRHVCLFLRALFVSLFLLHLRPFSASVRHFTRLRKQAAPFDVGVARELLSVYTYIRMFVFARRERCLLDSMVLVEFMASFGVFPKWVIGVQVRPFGAHSWAQHEHQVLNGTTGFVRAYRPILVV